MIPLSLNLVSLIMLYGRSESTTVAHLTLAQRQRHLLNATLAQHDTCPPDTCPPRRQLPTRQLPTRQLPTRQFPTRQLPKNVLRIRLKFESHLHIFFMYTLSSSTCVHITPNAQLRRSRKHTEMNHLIT